MHVRALSTPSTILCAFFDPSSSARVLCGHLMAAAAAAPQAPPARFVPRNLFVVVGSAGGMMMHRGIVCARVGHPTILCQATTLNQQYLLAVIVPRASA